MKSEMLNLQIQLHSVESTANCNVTSPRSEGLRRRSTSIASNNDAGTPDKELIHRKQEQIIREGSLFPFELHESPPSMNAESPSVAESTKHSVGSPHCEITEVELDVSESAFFDLDRKEKDKGLAKENLLISAVHMIGDGVSQVQSIGNQAVNNLASFLNIGQEDSVTKENLFAKNGV